MGSGALHVALKRPPNTVSKIQGGMCSREKGKCPTPQLSPGPPHGAQGFSMMEADALELSGL